MQLEYPFYTRNPATDGRKNLETPITQASVLSSFRKQSLTQRSATNARFLEISRSLINSPFKEKNTSVWNSNNQTLKFIPSTSIFHFKLVSMPMLNKTLTRYKFHELDQLRLRLRRTQLESKELRQSRHNMLQAVHGIPGTP